MADPTGPSGQPSPSNPFAQGQGMKADVSLSTGSAERTMADLQNVLEKTAKSFGVAFNATTKDTLKGQENFYKYIGDKENERRVALERYKRAAIDSIDEETKARIKSYEEEKHSQEEVSRYSAGLNKKAAEDKLHIGKETDKQLARSTGIGGVIRGVTSSLGGQIGGPIGGLISSAGNLLTNPYALAIGAILEMFNTKAAFTKTGIQLAGAGMPLGSGAGAGLGFATGLFNQSTFGFAGNLGQALSASQQRDIIGTMAGSHTMIDQARAQGGFGAIVGNLGLFANVLPDASKEMELFTEATKDLGMSQKDIKNLFVSSRVNMKDVNITQLDSIRTQMEMQKSLRNITNDGVVAADVLGNVGKFLKSMGTMSEGERLRVTSGIASAGANFSLPQIAGMFAFTHGRMPNLSTEVFGENGVLAHGGVFGLMGGFLGKVGSQFKDPNQRLYAADQLRQQFMPGLRLQDVPKFFDIANAASQPGANMDDIAKRFKGLESHSFASLTAEGISNLANIVDPIQRLENVFSNFWTMLDERISNIITHIPGMSSFHLTSYMPKGRMSPRDIGRFAAPADYYKNH